MNANRQLEMCLRVQPGLMQVKAGHDAESSCKSSTCASHADSLILLLYRD
jgi:hypothetical protein